MARGKQTFRMTTVHTPRSQPSVALNRDGTVQQTSARDPARERIRKMKADFLRAKKLMKEAQEIMAQVEISFLDLEKTDFQDAEEILNKNN